MIGAMISHSAAPSSARPRRLASSLLACAILTAGSWGCEESGGEQTAASASAAAAPSAPAPPLPVPTPTASAEPEEEKPPKRECPDGPKADFGGDELLEAEVRFKLQKREGDIEIAELKKVRSLKLLQGRVDAIDHCLVPKMTELRDIFLGAGKLDDLSPIAELDKVMTLVASGNRISDLTPLAKLTKMDRLDLSKSRVQDLSPLAKLTELTELSLDDTPVSDLGPLAGLTKLEMLSIKRTQVKDLSPLKGLESLKTLHVNGAPVDDIYVLGKLMRGGLKVIED